MRHLGRANVSHCLICLILGPRDWRLETRKTQKDVMSLDVTKCHICDIAWLSHKLIPWNGLDLEFKSNVTDFREKRILL